MKKEDNQNKTQTSSALQPNSRRGFIKTILAGAVISQVPWWASCRTITDENKKFVFNTSQISILQIVQNFLFPNDGNGPGAAEIKSLEYLQWVILDPKMDPNEIEYIFNGIKWVEETAQEEKDNSLLILKKAQQEEILVYISQQDWGESWYSVLLNFIFEALISDPVYGSNTDGIGWKWLNHNPGFPRPVEHQKYGNLLNSIHPKP